MKFSYNVDEWYPVFTVIEYEEGDQYYIELTQEEYDDYREVRRKFREWQNKLDDLEKGRPE